MMCEACRLGTYCRYPRAACQCRCHKRPEAAQPEPGQPESDPFCFECLSHDKCISAEVCYAMHTDYPKLPQPAPSAGTQDKPAVELQQLPEDLWRCIGANPYACKDFRCPVHGVMQPAPRGTARELAQEIAEWVNSGGPLDALAVKHLELRLENFTSQAAARLPDAEELARKQWELEMVNLSPWDELSESTRTSWIDDTKSMLAALAALRKEKG